MALLKGGTEANLGTQQKQISGPESLHPRVTKELSKEIATPIQLIFSDLTTDMIPAYWHKASMVPVEGLLETSVE